MLICRTTARVRRLARPIRAGSAYPLCSVFPNTIYGCLPDSFASYNPVGAGADGIGLWYKLVGAHPNIFMALSGHVRNPIPGNYPTVPAYNGVGYVNCNVQSWTTLCSNPNRPIQILSDFQGQGNNGYFGYGYLRILTVSRRERQCRCSRIRHPSRTALAIFRREFQLTKTTAITNSRSTFQTHLAGPTRRSLISPLHW